MSLQIRILKDELTPTAAKLKGGLTKLRPILEAVGLEVVSITQLAFRDESLRASPWPAKRSGEPSNLIKSGTLRRSIRITNIGGTSVSVGSDRVYAAIHQMGGTIEGKPYLRFKVPGGGWVTVSRVTMPARPFFPITKGGSLTSTAQRKVGAVLEKGIGAYLRP
jgi:phage gpG-like protein